MKRRTPIIAVLVVLLVIGVSVGSAWAYFTDSATATGGLSLSVKPSTSITEENGNDPTDGKTYKKVRVQNTSDMVSVWVRARAYAPEELGLTVQGTKWEQSGEWYVYQEPVPAKSETETLLVKFDLKKAYTSTAFGPQDGDVVNVTVLYESVPVTYTTNEAGETVLSPANWND